MYSPTKHCKVLQSFAFCHFGQYLVPPLVRHLSVADFFSFLFWEIQISQPISLSRSCCCWCPYYIFSAKKVEISINSFGFGLWVLCVHHNQQLVGLLWVPNGPNLAITHFFFVLFCGVFHVVWSFSGSSDRTEAPDREDQDPEEILTIFLQNFFTFVRDILCGFFLFM